MKLLTEIERSPGARKTGRTIYREAVRAIIWDGSTLLMVYSPKNGDYKFPGGGVDPGESPQQALAREVMEECGAALKGEGVPFGQIIEYDQPVETEFDVFQMTSSYYFCQVHPGQAALHLDDYEEALEFQPVWVEIDAALSTNYAVLSSSAQQSPLWTRRDTFVLEYLRQLLPPDDVAVNKITNL